MDNLIIFIKNPQLGRVKTRLAATVGDEAALLFYKKLLCHTRSVAEAVEAKRWLFYSEFLDENDGWDRAFFQKKAQTGQDLGEKMANAFAEISLFQPENGPAPMVIIGSDCAQLTPEILREAFFVLKKNDFVIGPALDGGYYLLGMNRPHRSVFEKIEWSSSSVFSETMKKIGDLGSSVHVLPALSDIDTEADWQQFAQHLH